LCKEADTGSLLEFDHSGRLLSVNKAARSVGTTVLLHNVFATMPVRQKEFQRNLKKEFARMCHVLSAYCLVR
jgi:DNA mismatch repair protein PMS2